MVDWWIDIEVLKAERVKVYFLRSYKLIKGDPKLIKHIIEGDIYPDGNIGGIHSIIAQSNGCVINPITTPDPSGIYKAYVGKFDANHNLVMKIDATGQYLTNDMFPDAWLEQQLFEELTYAFGNMIFRKGNQWEGTLRNGRTCTFCMKGLKKDKVITANTKVITIWPD